jgi:EAL domain-containing protein (putative c-di-GMP-specific phosphodiesterase class I)
MAQKVAQTLSGAGAVSSRRRSIATAVMFCAFCGLTIAAIGISIAAAYGAIAEAGLAAAVGIVGFVQLSILISNWRRAAAGAVTIEPAHEPHVTARAASAVVSQDRAGDGWKAGRDEPDRAGMTSTRTATNDATRSDRTDDEASEAAEPVTDGIDLLDEGQLDLLLEPVVELAETTTVYYRSSFSLTRHDGIRVGPYLLSLSAERGGFAPALDLALFRRVCPVIRHLRSRSRRPGVFCPLSPQSFGQRHVLDELIHFLRANKDAAGGMVIEISQSALAALSPAGMEGLAYLAELGATLSLSEARLEGPDPATLVLLGFRFFDVDVAALAGIHGWDAFSENGEICRLARRAEQAGLTVVAANVARAEELERVRGLVRLARGSLFSPPRVVRRDIADLPPAQAAAA